MERHSTVLRKQVLLMYTMCSEAPVMAAAPITSLTASTVGARLDAPRAARGCRPPSSASRHLDWTQTKRAVAASHTLLGLLKDRDIGVGVFAEIAFDERDAGAHDRGDHSNHQLCFHPTLTAFALPAPQSSAFRPTSNRFSAPIICASVCLLFDIEEGQERAEEMR